MYSLLSCRLPICRGRKCALACSACLWNCLTSLCQVPSTVQRGLSCSGVQLSRGGSASGLFKLQCTAEWLQHTICDCVVYLPRDKDQYLHQCSACYQERCKSDVRTQSNNVQWSSGMWFWMTEYHNNVYSSWDSLISQRQSEEQFVMWLTNAHVAAASE